MESTQHNDTGNDANRKGILARLEFEPKQDALTMLLIIVVSFIQAVAINGFYVPHRFLSGGITGISLLLMYLFEVPTWIPIIILNVPICIVGFKYLKPKIVLFSMLAFGVFAFAVAITKGLDFNISDPIIAALAGGAVIGITSALVVKRDATMGGIDIITMILSHRYSISMGTFAIIVNVIIMGTLSLLRGLELGLISILATCTSNIAFNAALRGLNRNATVFIISDKWDEIAQPVLQVMHRGVTYIPAEGGYTHAPKKLVYCIVKAGEVSRLKRIIREHDDKAIFSVIETQEVRGRGFGSINN